MTFTKIFSVSNYNSSGINWSLVIFLYLNNSIVDNSAFFIYTGYFCVSESSEGTLKKNNRHKLGNTRIE